MRQVVIHIDPEDGGWVCEVPTLPGCVSQGETKEEALTNIREAIDLWEQAARNNNLPIPPESFDVQVCVI